MAKTSLAVQADQITDLLGDFIRLKHHLKTVLPEDLARLKERLGELHPEGGPKRATDYDLFYRVGVILSRQSEPMTMTELSEALDAPLSTATRIMDWLVESGYVERLPDPDDRRIVRVALTDTGHELYQTISGFLRQRIEQILRRFTADERQALVSLLRRALEALEEPEK